MTALTGKIQFAAIALVSAVISSQTFAAAATVSPPEWEIGILLGGFKAQPGDITYANDITSLTAPYTSTALNFTPKYRLGLGVDATYQNQCLPYLFNISYFETANKKNQDDIGLIFPTLWPQATFGNFAQNAFSTLKTNYRLGTIAMGSTFCVNDDLSITPTLGLSYSFLKHHMDIAYNNNPADGANALATLNSKFNGFGPTIGGQLGYYLFGGLSISGNLQYSTLLGSLNSQYMGQYSIDTGIPSFFASQSRKHLWANQILSDISLNYNLPLTQCLCGTVNLGWRFIKLFNAAEFFDYNGLNTSPTPKQFNSSIQGPFIRTAIQF